MATHSSILVWRIPWTEEPGGYSPWGHKELDMTEQLTLLTPFSKWKTFFLGALISILYPSVQFSHSVMSDSLWPHELQHARPPCPSPTPRVYLNLCLLSRWCHPTISSSVVPSPPALNLSQHQGLFKWVSSLHHVAKVLEFQLQHQSFQITPRTDLL